MTGSDFTTRHTLLQRARNKDDHQAWDEFILYYKQFIFILLWNMRVPVQECDDIVQDILVRLWKNLATYDHDRAQFRTWLITIIRNSVSTHLTRQRKKENREPLHDDTLPMTDIPQKEDTNLDKMIQQEWENYIANLALKNISTIFSGNAIEAFTLSVEGLSNDKIAEQLKIAPSSVYKLRQRVKERLLREINRLRHELE